MNIVEEIIQMVHKLADSNEVTKLEVINRIPEWEVLSNKTKSEKLDALYWYIKGIVRGLYKDYKL